MPRRSPRRSLAIAPLAWLGLGVTTGLSASGQSVGVQLETIGPMSSFNQAAWWSPIVVSDDGRVYASYLAPNQPQDDVFVAERTTSGQWTIVDTQFDSPYDIGHTQTSIGLDGDGHLHVFYGMHGHPVRYGRTTTAGSITGGFTGMTPTAFNGGSFTYPNVTTTPNGDLYTIIRDFPIGELYHYDTSEEDWSLVNTFASQPNTTVYPDHVLADDNGDLHLAWEWASGGASGARHYGSYARFQPDTGEFFRADGTLIGTGDIDINSADIWQGLEGDETFERTVHGVQSAKLTLDDNGRPLVTYGYSTTGQSDGYEHRLARWTGSDWRVSTVEPGPFDIDKSWLTYSDGSLRHYGTVSPSDPVYSGSDDIFVRLSNDLGDTWSSPLAVTSGLNVQRPVGVTKDGVDYLYLPSVDEQLLRVAIVDPSESTPLSLEVDRASGDLRIRNLADATGSNGVSLDGYSIVSPSGLLNTAWSSLDDQGVADWQEANPSAERLSELKPTGATTIAGQASLTLGAGLGAFSSFGQQADLSFSYTLPDGTVRTGQVGYVGPANTLVLQIDPADGEARLVNQSEFSVEIDGYTIESDDEALLTTWNSLDDQDAGGGDWREANPTAGRLSEIKESAALTLSGGDAFDLGTLYDGQIGAGAGDVTFRFLMNDRIGGDSTPTLGVVQFVTLGDSIAGDFNSDGVVDAADYSLWRDNLGDPTEADINGNGDGFGGVNQADFAVWAGNLGGVADAATTVPEPNAVAVIATAVPFAIGRLRARKR